MTSPSIESVAGMGCPPELRATNFVEVVILGMDQTQVLRFFAHYDFVIHCGDLMGLPITGDMGANVPLIADHHANLGIAVNHDGPAAEGVRIEGHHHYGVETGVHDRTADTERIAVEPVGVEMMSPSERWR